MHPAKTKSDMAVDIALSLILQEKNDEDSLLVRHIESPAKVAEHRQKLKARSPRSSQPLDYLSEHVCSLVRRVRKQDVVDKNIQV